MDDTSRPEDDDLAALDYFTPDYGSGDSSDLDALDGYGFEVAEDTSEPDYAVTNPPGTVTVSAHLDGRVHHIELAPKVTTMTEAHLAEEIVVIARLATQDAKAAQYAFMLDGMRQQGHDDASTRDFLTRDLDLPSPEDAGEARAQVFATRYAGDHD